MLRTIRVRFACGAMSYVYRTFDFYRMGVLCCACVMYVSCCCCDGNFFYEQYSAVDNVLGY